MSDDHRQLGPRRIHPGFVHPPIANLGSPSAATSSDRIPACLHSGQECTDPSSDLSNGGSSLPFFVLSSTTSNDVSPQHPSLCLCSKGRLQGVHGSALLFSHTTLVDPNQSQVASLSQLTMGPGLVLGCIRNLFFAHTTNPSLSLFFC